MRPRDTLLLLTRKDIESVLKLDELYAALKSGFELLAAGRWQAPLRTSIEMSGGGGVFLAMPAYCSSLAAAGLKLATVLKTNPAEGLPAVHSAYVYVSGATGEILSIMDAEYLTGMRTAATTVLATCLAGNSSGKVVAVFGTGVQARFHVEAFAHLLEVREFLVLGRTPGQSLQFANEVRDWLGVEARPAGVWELRNAQVICTCTTNNLPLFSVGDVHPTVHINAVGAFRPSSREIGSDVVAKAAVIVDSREAALSEAGEIVMALAEGAITSDQIYASLDELVSGAKPAPPGLTLFKSLGMALEDLVAADLVYRRAIEASVGTNFVL